MIGDLVRDASAPLAETLEALGPDRWRFARFQFNGLAITVTPNDDGVLNEDVRSVAVKVFLAHGWGLGTTLTRDLRQVSAIHLRHPSTLSRVEYVGPKES